MPLSSERCRDTSKSSLPSPLIFCSAPVVLAQRIKKHALSYACAISFVPFLFTKYVSNFLLSLELDGTVNTQKRIQALRLLFLLLPPPNRLLLKKLIELLHLVSINPLSKMNAYNLGIVFSPNIIYNKKVSLLRVLLLFLKILNVRAVAVARRSFVSGTEDCRISSKCYQFVFETN